MAIEVVRPVSLEVPDPDLARRALAAPAPVETDDAEALRLERERKDKIVQAAIDRFHIAAEAEHQQRARELDDLKFEAGEQWPDEFRKARAGGIGADGVVTPARPCLTINKLDQPIQQVLTEARQARLGIQIKPRGERARKDIAAVRQGLIRFLEVESRAQLARHWALDRVAKCGRGAYRVLKAYSNDGDWDLDLVIARILNQHSVYLDPFAQEPDWSDGRWALVTYDYPEDEYRRRWGESALSHYDGDKFTALGDSLKEWLWATDTGKRIFRVAEYFYVVEQPRTLVYIEAPDPQTGRPIGKAWLDEVPPQLHAFIRQQRQVDHRQVKWALVNGVEVLDEEDWEGRYIPVVPVIGKEYNVGGKREWKGIVANAKDAQRSYNVMRSEQVMAVGLAPKAPWVLAEGQDEGYEKMWDESNTRNFTRLIYKPTSFEGHLVPPPNRNVAEPAIQAITLAAREADGDIKATTGRFDPSLGRPGTERSGRAIRELKLQGESGTSNYLDNLASMSMVLEGKILNDLLEHVYDRPGRVAHILDEEDQEQAVILNQPFKETPDGPQPLGPNEPFVLGEHKRYDLADGGQYRVVVTVGRSATTRREHGAVAMSELAEAAPALVPIYADLWVGSMDFPGAETIANRLKKANQHAKDEDDKTQPPLPPAVAAQVEQLQQQYAAAVQQVQQLQQQIATDQAKQAATIEKAKIDADTAIEIQKLKNAAEIAKAHLAARTKGVELSEHALEEAQALGHEALENARARQHEIEMAALTRTEPAAGQAEV